MKYNYSVFFDLDETIINGKSMLLALEFYFKNDKKIYENILSDIKNYSEKNKNSREKLNQYFYTKFSDFDENLMKEKCQEWFLKEGEILLNKSVIEEIKFHQDNQALIIIVSGSFKECVQPMADYLNIEHVICNQLEVVNGVYSGKLLNRPVIGHEKANRIKEFIQYKNMNFMGSYAYGDHISDLSMLMLADNPVIVGTDPQLMAYGQINGWKVIN